MVQPLAQSVPAPVSLGRTLFSNISAPLGDVFEAHTTIRPDEDTWQTAPAMSTA